MPLVSFMRGSSMDKKTKSGIVDGVRFGVFVCLAALLFFAISFVLAPCSAEDKGMRGYYAEQEESLDVLYVGGSISVVSWMPFEAWEECGIASYVYGKSTLRSYNVMPLVKEAFATQSPGLLVVDLRPFQYSSEGLRVEPDIALERNMLPFSHNRLQVIDNLLEYGAGLTAADTRTSFVLDIIRSHGTWRMLTMDSFEYAIPGLKESDTKGFLPIEKHESITLTDNSETAGQEPVSARAEADLRDFLEYVSTQECNVLFVVTPYGEKDDERRQYNYLASIIDEFGFDYINFNDLIGELGIDEAYDFYNTAHMNIFGAEKYTNWLARYISEHYGIPDRREDSAYEAYDDNFDSWVVVSDRTKDAVRTLIDEKAAQNAG